MSFVLKLLKRNPTNILGLILTDPYLLHRLSSLHPPSPEVEEVEKIALARLPSINIISTISVIVVVIIVINITNKIKNITLPRLPSLAEEQDVRVENKEKKKTNTKEEDVDEETGDGDSAIHLDCLQEGAGQFDSSDDYHSPCTSPRRLQRSVSDVVTCQMLSRGRTEECFPSPLYRGFLLRHQRRQKESREAELERDKIFNTDDVSSDSTSNQEHSDGCLRMIYTGDGRSSCAKNFCDVKSSGPGQNCLQKQTPFPLTVPVVRQGDLAEGRATKKTTIIIRNP